MEYVHKSCWTRHEHSVRVRKLKRLAWTQRNLAWKESWSLLLPIRMLCDHNDKLSNMFHARCFIFSSRLGIRLNLLCRFLKQPRPSENVQLNMKPFDAYDPKTKSVVRTRIHSKDPPSHLYTLHTYPDNYSEFAQSLQTYPCCACGLKQRIPDRA